RFYVCSHPTPSIMSTIKFNFVVALPTTICFILFNLGRSPLEEALPLFEKYVPQYNLSGARLEAKVMRKKDEIDRLSIQFGDTCIACSPLTTLYFVAPYR
ncbi:hypothetical protein PENTCL1PPCAC_10010, partial [Pristionchus entomophagus]